MGDAINMAARLMCLPEAQEEILCDERTFNLCKNNFVFESLGETKVKGKSSPISIYRPRDSIPETDRTIKTANARNALIGRMQEKEIIQELLDNLGDPGNGSVYLEGDGGQGLTTLTDFIVEQCEKMSVPYSYLI
jgi:hypothetical protein